MFMQEHTNTMNTTTAFLFTINQNKNNKKIQFKRSKNGKIYTYC